MNRTSSHESKYLLALADGSRWLVSSGDERSLSVLSKLSNAMQLLVVNSPGSPCPIATATDGNRVLIPHCTGIFRSLLLVDEDHPDAVPITSRVPLPSINDGSIILGLHPCYFQDASFTLLVRVSLIFARDAQTRGGVLIHGALAERNGIGVILAAPGGTGKTTASERLPAPWRSLCDDTTLVVRDTQGSYHAHPWPTWSRFFDDGPGGTWNVEKAVPLRSIFFLVRAPEDRAERIGSGQAVSLLAECAKQASRLMTVNISEEENRAQNLERFNNICTLLQDIPAHILHISLNGSFWNEIDRALEFL
ncbi:MAG: SynChlorMet cassette protein ScmC [Candidatus Riflebacteria bacterium]|nr:SynChlorMet cassette protein ScmC [Candidatus Riflebacteria bacterium]